MGQSEKWADLCFFFRIFDIHFGRDAQGLWIDEIDGLD